MFRIVIRAVGSLQEPWHQQAVHTYANRLAPFARFEIQEVAEGHQGSMKPNLPKTQETEGRNLLKNIPSEAIIIALDESGKELDSKTFARNIGDWGTGGRPIVFLIGGSWGLDPTVKSKSHFVLSLGKMTLPHSLARIVLTEQMYRAMTILSGKEYHK
jgi:23S rRNA (pseudouridine1915-N3)-methyltransferase